MNENLQDSSSPPRGEIAGECPAVVVENLSKSFPRRRTVREILRRPFALPARIAALTDISLSARQGEILGLLGPNGAGKTTLLKSICGLVLPEKGRLEVFGVPSDSPSLSGVIGLAHGDERSFYWRLTARENLEFFARLHALRGSYLKSSVEDLLERVDLIEDADRRFGDFSSGMKQRLGIARALLADPKVVLMDEPTRSLDPVSSQRLRRWICDKLHKEERKTILLATHNLQEAEELCDRVAVIARGRLRVVATPLELRRRGMSGPRYRFQLEGGVRLEQLEYAKIEKSASLGGKTEVLLRLESEALLDPLLMEIRQRGFRVVSIESEEPDLETAFHELIENADNVDRAGSGA